MITSIQRNHRSVYRLGFWMSIALLVGAVLYALLLLIAVFQDGLPPVPPISTFVSLVTYLSVPIVLFLWVAVHRATPPERQVFSLGSLLLITVFATLTSINRYNALTLVPQAVQLGQTDGLAWFDPYGWPSIMAAMEVQAWGFYFGLACLSLTPVFATGRLERVISWTMSLCGVLSLLACLGQVIRVDSLIFFGILAWGPGLLILGGLLACWFRHKERAYEPS